MGYPIANLSSSVDDEMAADIRKKIKGEAVTGTVEGRIELKTRTESVAAKTTTVIRRRSRAEKEETAKKIEEAEALVFEAETLAFEASIQEQAQAAEVPQPVEITEASGDAHEQFLGVAEPVHGEVSEETPSEVSSEAEPAETVNARRADERLFTVLAKTIAALVVVAVTAAFNTTGPV